MEKTQNFINETIEKLLDNYRRLYKKSGPCTLDTRLFPVSKYFDFNALLTESSQHSQDICVNSPFNLKRILIEKEWNKVCYNEALINKGATSDVISYASHFTPLFKKMLANMKKQNGLTIRIEGENLSIDELCNLAMKEAMLLKEATINIEFSKLPTAVFSKKFQKKVQRLYCV